MYLAKTRPSASFLWIALAITSMFAPAAMAADGAPAPWEALGIEMDGSWDEIATGVYQQVTAAGVETRAFGIEGLVWGLDQLETELVALTRLYVGEPSDTNRRHLEAHLDAIAGLQAELHRRATAKAAAKAPPCNSYVIYSADADAGVDPSTIWSSSEAHFSVVHNFGPYCPGTVYARAYAETTTGGFVFSDSDVCSQNNIVADCVVSASVFNATNCHSNSYAYASYPSWGYFTSKSATQTGCI